MGGGVGTAPPTPFLNFPGGPGGVPTEAGIHGNFIPDSLGDPPGSGHGSGAAGIKGAKPAALRPGGRDPPAVENKGGSFLRACAVRGGATTHGFSPGRGTTLRQAHFYHGAGGGPARNVPGVPAPGAAGFGIYWRRTPAPCTDGVGEEVVRANLGDPQTVAS
jgi:hypothetical protein